MKSKKITPLAVSPFTAGVLSINETPAMSVPALVIAILGFAVNAVSVVIEPGAVKVVPGDNYDSNVGDPVATFSLVDPTKRSGEWNFSGFIPYAVGRVGAASTNAFMEIVKPSAPSMSLATLLSNILSVSPEDANAAIGNEIFSIVVDQVAGVVQVCVGQIGLTNGVAYLAEFTLSDEIAQVNAGPARLAFE